LNEEQSELFGRISEIAQQAEEDTRNLSHSLDSGALRHFGLSVAITDLADAINQTDSCSFEFSNHLIHSVTGDVAMNVYRIIQELVNNTLKHAEASKILLEVTEISNEYLNIIYEDNGKGFDSEVVASGIGLKNIHSRVDQLDGSVSFDTQTAGRTTIILEIPLL
jgi:signal transduction histidine kinase